MSDPEDIIRFNFGFEEMVQGWPSGWWWLNGDSRNNTHVEPSVVHSGRYSMNMRHHNDVRTERSALFFELPDKSDGREITVSAYIKTEDVTDGYVGLFVSFNPWGEVISSENRITGTTDWTRYETTVPLNPDRIQVFVGSIFTGKGQMWMDDFVVTIDGREIYERRLVPADRDNEFDTGSGIEFSQLDGQQIDNLELLCKLWGFMKYHHPAVARGDYTGITNCFAFCQNI
jgi:hypothetical protein